MSLRTRLSSSQAIFAFESAARLRNFTHTASEFNVTQPAVSRMIARLEAHIGTKLFRRTPTGLELTEEGRILYAAVSSGFHQIEVALDELKARQNGAGTVTISASSAFSLHWFMPRFDRFQQVFPEIDVRFQLVRGEPTGAIGDVDLAIRHNERPSAEHHSWELMEEIILPVCSPSYLAEFGSLDDCTDMRRHTLAHLEDSARVPWFRYLSQFDYPSPAGSRSLTFTDYTLVIQAAIKGRAMALGWWHVVAHELLLKGLVPAGRHQFRTGQYYHLVATKRRPLNRSVALVRDWLVNEMAFLRQQSF